jgi:Pyruvate/2-oxoacid:ferredoxin oxidoreductase delta subunit
MLNYTKMLVTIQREAFKHNKTMKTPRNKAVVMDMVLVKFYSECRIGFNYTSNTVPYSKRGKNEHAFIYKFCKYSSICERHI